MAPQDTRIWAWLSSLEPAKPFDEVIFFIDADPVDEHTRLTYKNGKTMAYEELINASIVFRVLGGPTLYDRAALEAFINGGKTHLFYWGPKLVPQAAAEDPFLDVCEVADDVSLSDEDDLREFDEFSDWDESSSEAYSEAYSDASSEAFSEASSEASFACITASAHDRVRAQEKAVAHLEAIGKAFGYCEEPWHAPNPNIVFKKQEIRKPVLVSSLPSATEFAQFDTFRARRAAFAARRRRDPTVALRAAQANLRETDIVCTSTPSGRATRRYALVPASRPFVPRPVANLVQPVHSSVAVQREEAWFDASQSPDRLFVPAESVLRAWSRQERRKDTLLMPLRFARRVWRKVTAGRHALC